MNDCTRCGGEGFVTFCHGGNPDKEHREPCQLCGLKIDVDPRERDDDDGSTYADPRDEMDERLDR